MLPKSSTIKKRANKRILSRMEIRLKKKPKDVQTVTVLYRGSTSPNATFESWQTANDVKNDWSKNDLPMAKKILSGDGGVTPQLKSAAKTLNNTMATYQNAQFDLYGHSLGSMNGQYALASADDPERIRSAYLYQGPNIYTTLTAKERKQVNKLRTRIFNYVDQKDLIPIGYNVEGIGLIIPVDSKTAKDWIAQHMWEGYQFDKEGNLLVSGGVKSEVRIAQAEIQLSNLKSMAKKLKASGGKLTSSEQIFLDSSEALIVSNSILETINTGFAEIIQEYQQGIQEAEEMWQTTLASARGIGSRLTEAEIMDALEAGGASHASIVAEPVAYYEDKITEATSLKREYQEIVANIEKGINTMLEADESLAQQVSGS